MAAAATAALRFFPIASPPANYDYTRNFLSSQKPTLSSTPLFVADHSRRSLLINNAKCFRIRVTARRDRRLLFVSRASSANEESKNLDNEMEEKKGELESKGQESEEAWKQTLESFKVEAMKMREMSVEAYAIYSERAMVTLKDISEKLKIQTDKARSDISALAKELSEGSPDSIKDVVEVFSDVDEMKDASEVRDFHVGIPYGAFLALGGLVSFMLFESLSAIRFGVILGGALAWLSVLSLRAWRDGESSEGYLKGQTVIATIIFLRKWSLFVQRRSFWGLFMTLFSGAIVGFYIYRILKDSGKGESLEQNSSN